MQIFEGLFSYFLRECVSKQGNRQGIRAALLCSVALQEFALTDVSMGGRRRERKEAYLLYRSPSFNTSTEIQCHFEGCLGENERV